MKMTDRIQKLRLLEKVLQGDTKPLRQLKEEQVPKFTQEQIEERRQWLCRHHGIEATQKDVFHYFGRYDYQEGFCYVLPEGMKLFFGA